MSRQQKAFEHLSQVARSRWPSRFQIGFAWGKVAASWNNRRDPKSNQMQPKLQNSHLASRELFLECSGCDGCDCQPSAKSESFSYPVERANFRPESSVCSHEGHQLTCSGRQIQQIGSVDSDMDGRVESRTQPMDIPEGEGNIGCTCSTRCNERYLTSSRLVPSLSESSISRATTNTVNYNNNNIGGSRNSDSKMPKSRPQKQKPVRSWEDEEQLEPELIRVLVSRPEIASKPRDNIVLEGNMDLRTTFETSYEALAKMRLNGWRKFQADRKLQANNKVSQQDIKFAETTQTSNGQSGVGVEYYEDSSSENEDEDEHEHPDEPPPPNNSNPTTPALITTPNSGANLQQLVGAQPHTNSQPEAIMNGHIEEPMEADWLGGNSTHKQQQPMPSVCCCQNHQSAQTNSPQLRHQAIQATRADIDPDLSPIIVYDANLNRLEKVGLRKRSKYRPSTSLRAGGGGLFGDLNAASETRTDLPQLTMLPTSSPQPIASRDQLEQTAEPNRAMQSVPRGTGNKSPGCRRMFGNHANQRDHIRDHNIVSVSPKPVLIHERAFVDEHDLILDENQRDEAEAVLELQRITCQPNVERGNVCPIHGGQKPGLTARSSSQGQNVTGAIDDSPSPSMAVNTTYSQRKSVEARQSRLERICQHQNFDIFRNDDCPEAKN